MNNAEKMRNGINEDVFGSPKLSEDDSTPLPQFAKRISQKEAETKEPQGTALMTVDIPSQEQVRLKLESVHSHRRIRDIIVPELEEFLDAFSPMNPNDAARQIRRLILDYDDKTCKRTSMMVNSSLILRIKENAARLAIPSKHVIQAAFIWAGQHQERSHETQ